MLKTIFKLDFLRKDNLYTRFIIELILRRVYKEAITISILSNDNRFMNKKERLCNFKLYHLASKYFINII